VKFLAAAMTLYAWILVAVVIGFLFFIARFFEEKAGQRTYYLVFVAPVCLFLLASVRYAFGNQDLVGDFWGDALAFGGGVSLIMLVNRLRSLMVGDK
jgi:hypothetical protein